jgi:hypothetical protein
MPEAFGIGNDCVGLELVSTPERVHADIVQIAKIECLHEIPRSMCPRITDR